MKAIKYLATGAFAMFCIVALDACSKTKSNSNNNNNNCAISYDGQYRNTSNGALCAGGQTGVCTTGSYTTTTGQIVACQIGQPINTGYGQFYQQPSGYGYGAYPTGAASCQQYSLPPPQGYGVQYVPVMLGGSIQCVRYDLVAQYAQQYQPNSGYALYGADYYYAYPPEGNYGGNYGGCSYTSLFGGLFETGSCN